MVGKGVTEEMRSSHEEESVVIKNEEEAKECCHEEESLTLLEKEAILFDEFARMDYQMAVLQENVAELYKRNKFIFECLTSNIIGLQVQAPSTTVSNEASTIQSHETLPEIVANSEVTEVARVPLLRFIPILPSSITEENDSTMECNENAASDLLGNKSEESARKRQRKRPHPYRS